MRLPGERATWIAGAAALLACVLWTVRHPPAPLAHDEFSYLLAGETYAQGRLANPPHPMARHFETMHVLQQPAYASKYPPGQGLALAVGTRLGRPIAGVWLSMALAAAAVAWMLAGWLPRPWPLAGGLAFALHPSIAQAWGATYWGGAVATMGGALVYGALPRIAKRPSARHAVFLGLGGLALAVSRPLEGLVACLPVGAALAACFARERLPARAVLAPAGAVPAPAHAVPASAHAVPASARAVLAPARGVLAPARAWRSVLLVLVLAAALVLAITAAVNAAVTGDPLTLPYLEYHRQYEVAPLFLFQEPRPAPESQHEILRVFFRRSAMQEYEAMRSLTGFLEGTVERFRGLVTFFFGSFLAAVVAGAILSRRDPKVRFLVAACLLFTLLLAVLTFYQPHYAAPFVGAGILLATLAARRLWDVERGRKLVRAALVVLLAAAFAGHVRSADDAAARRASFALSRRGTLAAELAARGGEHLVLVRYAPDHNPHLEWVYNAADVDRAPVVWAREMDPEENADLIEHFAGRSVWLFEPDRDAERVEPYPVAALK